MSESGIIQSVKKALDALDCIVEGSVTGSDLGLGEIAEKLGLQPTTVRNILKTMEQCGYVSRSGGRGYCPGPKCPSLVRGGAGRARLLEAAAVPLGALAHRTGESLVLATLINGKRTVLLRVEGDQVIRVHEESLARRSVYSTVTARVLLAFASAGEVGLFVNVSGLPGADWDGIDSREKLDQALAEIRDAGFAEDVLDGKTAQLAFPVTENGVLAGCAGMYLPASRYGGGRREELREGLRQAAAEIAARL